MSKGTRDTLFLQGMILACAGILTKIIGFIYRIPMANFLGDQGNGIYSVAFGIYNIALTLSSYSLPLAVSKLVSHRTAKNEHRNARRVFRDSLLFAVLVGAAACAALYLGADALEELYHRPGLARPLRVLAPTTFVVAVLGVFRGFFQGHGNMVPTALSQIAEQIVNAVVSVIATYQFMVIYASSADVYSYGAAGGTLGTLAGAAAALLLFFWMFWLMRGTLRRRAARDHSRRERDSAIAGELVLTVIPIILSQTIYQIGYTIDDFLFGNIMAEKGFSDAVISSLQGVFNTQYNQLINLPVAVATAMAASALPAIIRAGVQGGAGEVSRKIDSVIKFNMVIAFPSAAGLTVLGGPIVKALFPRLPEYQDLAAMLLTAGSAAVVFYALSTITTSILQGQNYMRLPVFHSGVSLIIHVILVWGLLKYTDLGVYGLVIGNVSFPVIVSLLNMRAMAKRLRYRWKWKTAFGIPLTASLGMGAVTAISYRLVRMILPVSWLALLASIAASVLAYGMLILRLKCFTRDELLELPMGTKLVRLMHMK